MIDPLAAVMSRVASDADLNLLTSGRIAAKHKYALPATDSTRWPTPSKALVLSYGSGSDVDRDTGRQLPRIEARCYGESEYEAGRVYRAVIAITRRDDRVTAVTGDGTALIYWLLADGPPSIAFDVDVQLDMVLVALVAAVAEDPIT